MDTRLLLIISMKFVITFSVFLSISSCVTWVRDDFSEEITQGMVGAIIETKQSSNICYNNSPKRSKFSTGYFIFSPSLDGAYMSDNTYILESCPPGTRARVIRFIKERDASQHIWSYVEFEMDDPRLKQKYRIVRMIGLRGDTDSTPWDAGGDFRVVSNIQ